MKAEHIWGAILVSALGVCCVSEAWEPPHEAAAAATLGATDPATAPGEVEEAVGPESVKAAEPAEGAAEPGEPFDLCVDGPNKTTKNMS